MTVDNYKRFCIARKTARGLPKFLRFLPATLLWTHEKPPSRN